MTPKEKAKELVDKFNNIPSEEPCFMISLNQSKNCALICVDEMIKAHKRARLGFSGGSEVWNKQLDRLKELQTEIEKL